jgi:RNA polymerase sigma-70 factor, ECF subfamily
MTERARFERLALGHMGAAYNLAFWLLRARAEAEDAVQDAYIRAYRAFHQLQGADVKPWLLTIVRNVCYRYLQERRQASNVISLDEALSQRPAGAAIEAEIATASKSPEEAAIDASERSVLARAIDSLPPAYREVIVLREIEELSYGEIADVIGAPAGTVMSRLSRARAELRTRMTGMMNQDGNHAM